MNNRLNRRDFLKISSLSLGSLAFNGLDFEKTPKVKVPLNIGVTTIDEKNIAAAQTMISSRKIKA